MAETETAEKTSEETKDEKNTTEETTEESTAKEETTEESGEQEGKEPDWKRESRKHENRAKQEKREREKLAAELAELKKGQQSEQEKAIEDAKTAGKAEAEESFREQRRKDQLEIHVTRLAAKTFADTEDALLHVERGIAAGDIDADDIFNDEGKVQTAALKSALEDLLERKPHLKAGGPTGQQPTGDADGGKGKTEEKDPDMNDLIRGRHGAPRR